MSNDIDKTLEKIAETLEENTLPKAAPTQFGINPPLDQYTGIRCSFGAICSHDSCDYQIQPVSIGEESSNAADAAYKHRHDTGHLVKFHFYVRLEDKGITLKSDFPMSMEQLKSMLHSISEHTRM